MSFPKFVAPQLLILFISGLNQGPPKVPPPVKIVLEKDDMIDIVGIYTLKGKEASGKNYNGITTIVRKVDIYLITWVVGGSTTFNGVGIRQGDTLAVSWAITSGEKVVIRGVNLYKIEPGPRLVGKWATVPGPGTPQPETLTFLKAIDLDEE